MNKGIEIAQAKSDLFQLLSIAFSYPTEELAKGLLEGSFQSDLDSCLKSVAKNNTFFEEPLKHLYNFWVNDEKSSYGEILREMRIEYTWLFIGPKKAVVYPYESMYCDSPSEWGDVLLMVGPSAEEVKREYKDVNFKVGLNDKEPPDFIATELEFLMSLYFKEANSLENGNDEEAKQWRLIAESFMIKHLNKWGELFCRDVYKNTRHQFYKNLAQIAEGIIESDNRR
ncbi:molecular chaperone TorD family protein [Desulfitobacterium sp.]|uniref:TorD/DmsD family molecular chaperone n=1 Tax=Desulfitobacterium sp. TaxID=49981 RepID=UPI002B1F2B38|nr:molecular chaperone TorD family protein [Desulfitobacterium sp.]MEA4901530.1 molecular chaperone TorD family protein [Desulfitobacterium sp.]